MFEFFSKKSFRTNIQTLLFLCNRQYNFNFAPLSIVDCIVSYFNSIPETATVQAGVRTQYPFESKPHSTYWPKGMPTKHS